MDLVLISVKSGLVTAVRTDLRQVRFYLVDKVTVAEILPRMTSTNMPSV